MIIKLTCEYKTVYVNTKHIVRFTKYDNGSRVLLTTGGIIDADESPELIMSMLPSWESNQ